MPDIPPEVDSLVRSRFDVTDSYILPEDEVEYRVKYGAESKSRFEELHFELERVGFTPWLTGSADDCTLTVRKRRPPKPSVSRIPVVLVLLTVASVVVFALLEREIYSTFGPSIPGFVVLLSYCACMVGVLAAHELGHRYIADRRRMAPPTPYFIPGIPDITAFLSSLGIVSVQREPAVNRDAVFEMFLAGPLAALAVAVVLYAVSEFAAVQSAVPLIGGQLLDSHVTVSQVSPSLIQLALDYAFSPFGPPVAAGFAKLSPIADASTVGFLLTFLSLLPMALFDGGYMAAMVMGERRAKIATYLSIAVLLLLDTPTYWAAAVIVWWIAGRQSNIQVLDGVSDASPAKKAVFALAIVLAIVCLPVPQNFATFPLGW